MKVWVTREIEEECGLLYLHFDKPYRLHSRWTNHLSSEAYVDESSKLYKLVKSAYPQVDKLKFTDNPIELNLSLEK